MVPVFLGAALLCPTLATAQTPPRRVRLHVSRGVGAERCPDAEALRETVRGRLGYDPFTDPPTARVELAFVRHGGWLVAELRVGGLEETPSTPRVLRTRAMGCETLGASSALALSLAIDALPESPPAVSATAVSAPAVSAPAVSAPVVSAVSAPVVSAVTAAPVVAPPAVTPPARPERGWELGADALMAVNLAPQLSFGARVNAEYRFGLGRVTFGVMAFAPVALRETNGSVRVSAYLGTVGACVGVSVVSGCLLVAGGALRGEGFDVGIAHDAVTPFFLAGLRLALETPRVGPFRGRLTAELLAPMTPTTHRIDARDVWETPPVAATVGLGVSARIP
jgi:hypothetical protein